MLDNKILKKLRLVYGVRVENYRQRVSSFSGLNVPSTFDTTYLDVLPSANAILSLTEKTALRLSGSRTVSRPEFRELAPFTFYDFNLSSTVRGQSRLVRTNITNIDLRYEGFFSRGQTASLSAFYKDFQNPIEQIIGNGSGAGSREYTFANIPKASAYGLEGELRLTFGGLKRFILWEKFDNFSIYANAAVIRSEIRDRRNSQDTLDRAKRPLQGQSPYLVNAAFQYTDPKTGLGFAVLFNRIGRRIYQVGDNQVLTIWEAPRSVLDAQVSKRFGKRKALEIRLTMGDVLNQDNTFYQDQPGAQYSTSASGATTYVVKEGNGKYNSKGETKNGVYYMPDTVIQKFKYGFNGSFGISYRFK